MTTTMNLQPTARQRFTAMVESRTVDQAISALVLTDTSTAEGMMVHAALISHIEKSSPAIAEWVANFYPSDFSSPLWDVAYVDAILLARAAVTV
jgi:hypothetical protein